MLRHLSEDAMPSTLSQGDGGGQLAPARRRAIRATSRSSPKAAISTKHADSRAKIAASEAAAGTCA